LYSEILSKKLSFLHTFYNTVLVTGDLGTHGCVEIVPS
jgi:hypothetical protein